MELELEDSNMYASGELIEFSPTEQGLFRQPLSISPENGDRYHTVKQGDRLDALANRYYRDKTPNASHYWWILADANQIENPLNLSELEGTKILVPDFLRVRLLL